VNWQSDVWYMQLTTEYFRDEEVEEVGSVCDGSVLLARFSDLRVRRRVE
jgi:hypothetical protein